MSTEFCQKCRESHPGRVCDYDDQGECAETGETEPEVTDQPVKEEKRQEL
jgi:hypothetical protein